MEFVVIGILAVVVFGALAFVLRRQDGAFGTDVDNLSLQGRDQPATLIDPRVVEQPKNFPF